MDRHLHDGTADHGDWQSADACLFGSRVFIAAALVLLCGGGLVWWLS